MTLPVKGKHYNTPIEKVPADYLRWLLTMGRTSTNLKTIIKLELDARKNR